MIYMPAIHMTKVFWRAKTLRSRSTQDAAPGPPKPSKAALSTRGGGAIARSRKAEPAVARIVLATMSGRIGGAASRKGGGAPGLAPSALARRALRQAGGIEIGVLSRILTRAGAGRRNRGGVGLRRHRTKPLSRRRAPGMRAL